MSYKHHIISTRDEQRTSAFGKRTLNGRIEQHNGIDFTAVSDKQVTPRGVDILAFADGEVSNVYYTAARGHVIDIAHNSRYTTRYQHLRNGITLKVGDKVTQGQAIAVMGNTGSCSSSRKDVPKAYLGTHLHFEFLVDGAPVDPEPYLYGEKSIGNSTQTAQSPAPASTKTQTTPAASTGSFKVGDTVILNGAVYLDSYGTGKGRTFTNKRGKITIVADSKRACPYHFENLGWVRAADLMRG